MDRVQSMFGRSSTTIAGQAVDKATSTVEEDERLFLEVATAVNSYNDGAKDAVKVIKRKLSQHKNFSQVLITLSLIDYCLKNCGSALPVLLSTKEFCVDIVLKLLYPKNNPTSAVMVHGLDLVRQLAVVYKPSPILINSITIGVNDLKMKGFQLPTSAPSALHAWLASLLSNEPVSSHPAAVTGGLHPPSSATVVDHHHQAEPRLSARGPLTTAQRAKLNKDLDIVQGNIRVFSEMLTELSPSTIDSSDLQLMQELNRTCKAMQQRIVELIGSVNDEEVTVQLLRINDDLNNIFLRHERFEKYRTNQVTPATVAEPPSSHHHHHHQDLNVLHQMRGLNISHEPPPSYSDTEQPTPVVNDLIDLSFDPVPAAAATEPKSALPPAAAASSSSSGFTANPFDAPPSMSVAAAAPIAEGGRPRGISADDMRMFEAADAAGELDDWLNPHSNTNNVMMSSNTAATVDNSATDEFASFLNERATTASRTAQPGQFS